MRYEEWKELKESYGFKDKEDCYKNIDNDCMWSDKLFSQYKDHIKTYDRVGIVGSRTFNDYKLLKDTLDNFSKDYKIGSIVSGNAKGADIFGERYAKENRIPTLIFKPEWNKNGHYNPRAGMDRNTLIVVESDILFAFWDNKSTGTLDSITKANKRGIEVIIVEF